MGDCDKDSDCEQGLRCGVDNCEIEFSHEKSDWKPYHDCCTGEKYILVSIFWFG